MCTLEACFHNHVKRKIKVCQQSNRCLPWVHKNLAVVVSWMIVISHLKKDMSCLPWIKMSPEKSLWKQFLGVLKQSASSTWLLPTFQSIWICLDLQRECHWWGASSDRNNDNSHFYHYFPSKTSARANSCLKEGYFEYLTTDVSIGFLEEHQLGCFLKSGRLLMYSRREMD